MKKGKETCPVARTLDLIGDRWSLLVIRDAFDNKKRFGDFQSSLGIARNILTDRLKKLVEEDILEVRPASDGTSYSEYVLTEKGEGLFPVIVSLRQWGEHELFDKREKHSTLIDKKTGKPIPYMVPTNSRGEELSAEDTEVKKEDS